MLYYFKYINRGNYAKIAILGFCRVSLDFGVFLGVWFLVCPGFLYRNCTCFGTLLATFFPPIFEVVCHLFFHCFLCVCVLCFFPGVVFFLAHRLGGLCSWKFIFHGLTCVWAGHHTPHHHPWSVPVGNVHDEGGGVSTPSIETLIVSHGVVSRLKAMCVASPSSPRCGYATTVPWCGDYVSIAALRTAQDCEAG